MEMLKRKGQCLALFILSLLTSCENANFSRIDANDPSIPNIVFCGACKKKISKHGKECPECAHPLKETLSVLIRANPIIQAMIEEKESSFNKKLIEAEERKAQLTTEVEKLKSNEIFYLELKRRLEAENAEMVEETKSLRTINEALEEEVADATETVDDLKDKVTSLERDLSKAKDDNVRVQRALLPVELTEKESDVPKVSQIFVDEVLNWAHKNSIRAFPADITVANEGVTLTDRSQQIQLPIPVGGRLRALRFHPSADGYLVVAQLNSDKLLSTMKIENSNFVEVVAPNYVRQMNSMGKSVKNPYSPKKLSNQTDEKNIEPHGERCVCKECRRIKAGKGSLFPE
jgi:hypothetical protein